MQTSLLNAIDELYAAALEPDRWNDVLTRVAEETGGFGATIISLDERAPALFVSSNLIDASVEYAKHWHQHDTLQKRAAILAPRNGIATDRDLVSDDLRRRDPYLNDFWSKFGIGGMAGYALTCSPDSVFAVTIQRRPSSEYFSDRHISNLRLLGGHARRALNFSLTLQSYRDLAYAGAHALDAVTAPLIVLDKDCNVVTLTARALGYFSSSCGIKKSRLVLSHQSQQERLESYLRAVDRGVRLCSAIEFADDGGRIIVGSLYPMPKTVELAAGDKLQRNGVAILVFTRRSHNLDQRLEIILQALGLSVSEAKVARMIASGCSIEFISQSLSRSQHTIRSQIKSVFSKLGVRRQAEVASLLTKLSPQSSETALGEDPP